MPAFTQEQLAFIAAVRDGQNIAGRAVAGSGKTTTVVEAVQAISGSSIMLAFNKRNADDLRERVPSTIVCKTMNGLGHSVWYDHCRKRLQVNADKCAEILFTLPKLPDPKTMVPQVLRLVSLAKQNAFPCGILKLADMPFDRWEALAMEHDIDKDAFEFLSPIALEILQRSTKLAWEGKIDFDDQLYMPVMFNARFPSYDRGFVDEAQDLSPLQHEMFARLRLKQRVIIGDPNQAIYAFRGVSESSFSEMVDMFDLSLLSLTYCFRCPELVVKEARNFVADIKAPPGTDPGIFAKVKEAKPGGAELCRYNAPLLKRAFDLIQKGLPVNYLGRDFISGLKALNKKAPYPADLLEWRKKNLSDAKSKGAKQRIEDRFTSMMVLHESAKAAGSTVEDILNGLLREAKAGNATTLATIHKAKGMEWQRVTFIDYDRDFILEQGDGQERNIAYVGVTRAQGTLHFTQRERRQGFEG